MREYSFAKRVKEHFSYLVDKYGFSIVEERYDPKVFGNGLVRFQSLTLSISVVLDRGQVLIDFTPYPEMPGYQFDLGTVIKFLALANRETAYIFPEKWDDYYEMIEHQIVRAAHMLKQYCAPVLKGQFSEWNKMYESQKREALDKYKAS